MSARRHRNLPPADSKVRPILGAVCVAAAAWVGLTSVGILFGTVTSFYTGQAEELPKWNGFEYLAFCMKEGAMEGAILATPLVVAVFVFAWLAMAHRSHRASKMSGKSKSSDDGISPPL